MTRWRRRLLFLLVVAGAGLILRATLLRPSPVPVTVYRVERGRVEETVVNSRAGTVESRRRAKMSPGIAGLVAEIPVEKGQRVGKGDVLLRLDDEELTAQERLAARTLDTARAAAREACLAADQAARDLARTRSLAADALVSEQQLEDAQTRAAVGEASCHAARQRVKEAEASLAAARATLAKSVVTAPFAGILLDVDTEVGEWISPSPPGVIIPPVLDLIDPEALYVSAPIDEADVARLELGLPVRITMDAFPGQSFRGEITYVASFVETRQEQNRTLTVEAELGQGALPRNLLPGLSADVEVILDSRRDVLRVPTYALLEGDRVLVVRDGKLESAEVDTGLRNWDFTEIAAGISEGDRVVVSLDRPEVKAGATVEITGEIGR